MICLPNVDCLTTESKRNVIRCMCVELYFQTVLRNFSMQQINNQSVQKHFKGTYDGRDQVKYPQESPIDNPHVASEVALKK